MDTGGWSAAAFPSVGGAGAPDPFFGEEIDVRVVNLEVVVEDRSGARVHRRKMLAPVTVHDPASRQTVSAWMLIGPRMEPTTTGGSP